MEFKTLVRISVNNANQIMNEIDLSSIDAEEPLRIIHSLLDEMKLDVIDRISELKEKDQVDIEDIDNLI